MRQKLWPSNEINTQLYSYRFTSSSIIFENVDLAKRHFETMPEDVFSGHCAMQIILQWPGCLAQQVYFWDEGKSRKFPCSGLTGLTNGILGTLCCPLQWVTMYPVHHDCNGDKTPRSEVNHRVTLHPLVANCMGAGGIECPSFIILLPKLVLSKVWEQGIMMVNCSQVFTGERLADIFLAPLIVIECYNYN